MECYVKFQRIEFFFKKFLMKHAQWEAESVLNVRNSLLKHSVRRYAVCVCMVQATMIAARSCRVQTICQTASMILSAPAYVYSYALAVSVSNKLRRAEFNDKLLQHIRWRAYVQHRVKSDILAEFTISASLKITC